jgi:DNA-binding transcriptional LysR family regulator
MELYQLRTFLIVAEEQSITRAAKRLFTTPPSVSGHIKALEDEWNVALFRRTAKGMEITEKGEQLRVKAEAALLAAQDLANHATGLRGHLMGAVRLGLNASADALRVPSLLRRLQEQCPGVEIRLANGASGRVLADLRSGHLDAGFVFEPVLNNEVECCRLAQMPLAIAIPAAWAPQAKSGGWPAIAALPWIYTDLYCPFQVIAERLLQEHGGQPQTIIRADDDHTRLQLIEAGMGIALVERAAAEQLAAAGKAVIWKTDPVQCDLSFAHLPARKDDPLVRAVRLAVLETWGVAADLLALQQKLRS